MPDPAKEPATLMGRFSRLFGDLRVRPKLIVLHNLFFLVLACGVYFSLIPRIEERTAAALVRETALIRQIFAEGRSPAPLQEGEIFGHQEGSAEALQIPGSIRAWLDENPGAVWEETGNSSFMYRKDPQSGLYARLTIPLDFYDDLVAEAKTSLFLVLGVIYVLAVLLLELVVMPRYVYRPIRLTLEADKASRRNDRERELVDEEQIPGDEIGDIMRSRNATVSKLRRQEEHLAQTGARLEELANDLRKKNVLLEAAKSTMAAQDRLVSLGLLSASVVHELNTPLAVLHGSIEQLMESVQDQPARQRLERMQRMTERLRRISVGLLDFSRPRREETEAIPVRRLVKEAWGLVAFDEKAAGVRFLNQVHAEDRVLGNYDRLMQVFVNLLRNAMYAVHSHGHIVVRSRQESLEGRRWVTTAVEDDGPGIPEEMLPSIFEAFVTSRLDSRGTGLGLAVAQGIVSQHGGVITASNREEGGARLEVRLPAVTE